MPTRPCWLLVLLMCGACGGPYRPPVDAPVATPDAIADFAALYGTNCAGCHGASGEGGVALGLGNPIYLAIVDDDTLRRATADGIAGTAMPAFARGAGGMLTDQQVRIIVDGIRARWSAPAALGGVTPPPYRESARGDPARGAAAFGSFCAPCHGAGGRGGARAGPIVDRAYLQLVSGQGLRTTIIAGRPDLGHPDWRGATPGVPMSNDDVTGIVAWLATQPVPADRAEKRP